MAFEIKHVSKSFGHVLALDNVSLTLEENHIYGLLGNNGAGKSTLMNIMTNRLYPTSGSVTVDGAPVADNDAALGKLFLMGEENLFSEDMKVQKAFRTAALFYPGFDMDYANALSNQFGLNSKKKISSLSTGYASIFRLILALSTNAPYLLLDEPVLGLDAQHRDLFYRLLMEKYTQNPCTIILSTHLIAEVENLVEHAIIIRNGRILRDAPCHELLTDAYAVSGPAGAMDAYLAGRKVLSQTGLGGLKTACVQGHADEELPQGLELSRVNLQDYFISLMDEEDHNVCTQ